jgi:NitT/TauT family transport system permease protein
MTATMTDAIGTVTTTDEPRPSPARGVLRRVVIAASVVIAVLGMWWAVLRIFSVESYFMPGPGATLSRLVDERGTLASHAWVTGYETLIGIAVASLFAVALAAVFVTAPAAERALLPVAITLRSIPIVAIAPLITLIVGRGLTTSIVCVTIVSFFPVLVNTARGLRAVTAEMRELFRVTGASKLQEFRYARFPVTIPFLFAGLRSAAAVAVLGAMLAEWLTGTQGLGYLLTNAAALRDLELLWSVVIVASLLSLGCFAATAAVERVLVRWSTGVPA